jgi:thioredoxin 1
MGIVSLARIQATDSPVLDVVCLCAEWCGTCRDYRAVFEALQAAEPGHRYRWIDIEDEADQVGDIDIETFPTLLVAHHGRVLFAGPVLPRVTDAQRLLQAQQERVKAGEALSEARGLPGVAPDQAAAYRALARQLASN